MIENPQHPQTNIKKGQRPIGFFQSFSSHPASVGETYFGHLYFAARFAFRLFKAGGAALVHAIIPAWFETTASRQVETLHDELTNRHAISKDD